MSAAIALPRHYIGPVFPSAAGARLVRRWGDTSVELLSALAVLSRNVPQDGAAAPLTPGCVLTRRRRCVSFVLAGFAVCDAPAAGVEALEHSQSNRSVHAIETNPGGGQGR